MMKFNEKYNPESFRQFLTDFLPEDFSEKEEDILMNRDRYKVITTAKALGFCASLDLYVMEMEHNKEKDPRVTITTDAFKILADNWIHRALVIFRNKDSENYRFSYLMVSLDINDKNKAVKKYSNARRYSFYLGIDAKIKTAEEFLIKKGKVKNYEDLVDRFNVEIVTKEFYKNYKKLFENLLDHLKDDKGFSGFSKKHGLKLEIFAKKLLGQIVFLYFLQKKGWLGAPKNQRISRGDEKFLRSLFSKCQQEDKNFFNDYLEYLFYDCLNSLPNMAGSFYRERFDCQIPFLNGGLFEPISAYKWQDEFINIPNSIFSNLEGSGILDIFDLYNFTIDENTPDDQEISVDPEMLGKVFENLLEDNIRKGQGAFYTPREIVHYMCQESLINYLSSNSKISEEKIKRLIKKEGIFTEKEFQDIDDVNELEKIADSNIFLDKPEAKILNELLQNIKIVDPACGSGAFLVGMLHEVAYARLYLHTWFLNTSRNMEYTLKKETIQNCLYGVDIDPGAIDIAKLRFWLSVIVDESIEDIEPLPNLDYKIMQGNSLLEDLVIGDSVIPLKFEGKKKIDGRTKEKKDLFAGGHQAKLFIIDESEALVEKLEKYHAEYFNVTDPEKKKILKKKIDGVEDELIQSKCNEEIERADSFIENNPDDSKKILKYTEKILAIKEVLRKWKIDHLRPFFPWKLHFGEVFSRENGGFDIVIANPPYGADIDKKELKFIKGNLANTKNGNSAAVFIDFGKNKWINEAGTLSYIVPKSLLYSEVWLDLVLSMLGKIPFVIDVEKAFENVKLEQVVFMYGKKIKTDYYIGYKFLNNVFLRSTKIENFLVEKYKALICDVSQEELSIGEKISKNDIAYLGTISKTKRGIGLQKYLKKDGDHPVIGGKNIYKFGVNGCKGYVCDGDLNSNKNKFEFLKQSKIISQNIVSHIQNPFPHMMIIAAFDEKGTIFNLDTVNNTIITNKEYDYNFILGLLNSKLISWYAYKFIYCSAIRTMHFDNYYVGKIPIIKSEPRQQQKIIDLVDKIFELTRLDGYINNQEKQSEVLEYEKQIDQMVYDFYGLTKEEIKIVEGG